MRKRKIFIVAVIMMAVGFAAVTTNLVINGSVGIGNNIKDYDIYFSEAIIDEADVSAKVISSDGKNITFSTKELINLGETTILAYKVKNASTQYDAEVTVSCSLENDKNIEEYVEYNNTLKNEIINAGEEGSGVLTIKLKKAAAEQMQSQMTCEVVTNATERANANMGGNQSSTCEGPTYSFSGIILDETGNPLANKNIVIYPEPAIYATTDENGYINIPEITKCHKEMYVFDNEIQIEELKQKTKEEIAEEAKQNTGITITEEDVTFENNYETKNVEIKEKPVTSATYSLYGYLKDEGDNKIPNAVLVIYSENPHYVKTDNRGYFYVGGLEEGSHEIYYLTDEIEEIENNSKEEITARAVGFANITTSTRKITLSNGNKIENYIIEKENARRYNITMNANGGVLKNSTKEVSQNKEYGQLEIPEREGYEFKGWYYEEEKIEENYLVAETSSHTLEAHWQVKGYTINFDANGGSVETTEKAVTFDGEYGELPTPVNLGYEFLGWYTNTDYETEINATTKVKIAGNHTLYARWKASTYIVTFNSAGGSNINEKEVSYNGVYGELETPERKGYEFQGWYLGDTMITSTTRVTITENHTLEAHWQTNKYTITFDSAGGSEINSKEIEYDGTYGTLPNPTRVGYTFTGWYNGENQVSEETKVTTTENLTLTAHWRANKYIITFNANTGSVGENTKEVTYDSEYGELPTPEKAGYTFTGWYTTEASGSQVTGTTKVTITENQNLYAHWVAKTGITYTVKHWQQKLGRNANEKNESNYTLVKTDSLTGTTDEVVNPETNTYEGFTTPTKESITIKADGSAEVNYYYSRNKYTLTINRGTGVENVSGAGSHEYGESITVGYTISTGYTYTNITGDQTSQTFTMPARDVTIQVNGTANSYTIGYVLNSGTSGSSAPTSATFDSILNISNPTRVGYTFAGWTITSGLNATTAKSGTSATNVTNTISTSTKTKDEYFKNLTDIANRSVTLTANWTANTYTVSFDSNGGNNVTTTLTVTYDGTYGTTLPTATRVGYTFVGWYTASNGGSKVESTTKVTITSNQTLYAHWTIKSYIVTLKANTGGSVSSSSVSVNYGGTNTFTITPSSGYYLSSLTCTNGYTTNASVGKGKTSAQIVTIANNNKDLTSTCTVSFTHSDPTLVEYVTNLAKTDTTNLAYDGTIDNNLRYIGISPNNYVSFNGELWRIIGVMNNIQDSTGNKASHIKLIRAESIGSYSWDNTGTYGKNDWSKSAIMKVLNSGAYYNRASGSCPSGDNGATTSCNFSNSGLTNDAKNMISNVVWNLGGLDREGKSYKESYTWERGTSVYSGNPITWTGKVGLIYPSDYGYAVSGTNRSECLNWDSDSSIWQEDTTCNGNNWLTLSERYWMITSSDESNYNTVAGSLYGDISWTLDKLKYSVIPAVYIDSNINKVGGTGTINNPFIISR